MSYGSVAVTSISAIRLVVAWLQCLFNEVLDAKIVKSALSQADLSIDELKELLR